MINYDVPEDRNFQGKAIGDAANYQHRIGRTGRFGAKGIALTLHDRDVDEEYLNQIIKHFDLAGKIQELKGADHLKQVFDEV